MEITEEEWGKLVDNFLTITEMGKDMAVAFSDLTESLKIQLTHAQEIRDILNRLTKQAKAGPS